MKHGSLFTGIGGIDLAFERAGAETVFQIENDPHANTVLEQHWPDTPRWADIRKVAADDLPAVDVLSGGFPCQDYSVAGTREGLAGDRGALWWDFHRLISRLTPEWVLAENVPGLLSSRGGADFRTIVRSLIELGYGVAWRVLDAQYFGVAQRRRRVFIVGHSGSIPRPEVLFEPESLPGDPPPRRPERKGVAWATEDGARGSSVAGPIGSVASGSGHRTTDVDAAGAYIVNRTFAVYPESGQGADLTAREVDISPAVTATAAKLHDRGIRVISPVTYHESQGEIWQENDVAPALDTGSAGTRHLSRAHAMSANPQQAVVAFAQNQRNELRDLGDIAGALAAEPGMKQTTYLASPTVRRLTPLECERLQGFPDHWTAVCSDTQRYKQTGNAVAVPVAEWVARRIMNA